MNTPSNVGSESAVDSRAIAPTATSTTRPLYWSVRRELWENRSVTIAPIAVATVVLFGCLISAMTLPHRMSALLALDPGRQHRAIAMPYNVLAGLVIATAFIVGAFYCLEALHSERRDRSILFWKSLPVSDRTTVLSKAGIPLVVLPLLAFVLIALSQGIMLFLSTVVLLGSGPGVAALWSRVPFFQMSVAQFYALIAIALWHAPIYGWLLLISGWARRAPILWAVLPMLAIGVVERVVFSTSHVGSMLKYRLIGWLSQAFVSEAQGSASVDPLAALTPGTFLGTPGLWVGLAFAAACLAAAARLRRYREPI